MHTVWADDPSTITKELTRLPPDFLCAFYRGLGFGPIQMDFLLLKLTKFDSLEVIKW